METTPKSGPSWGAAGGGHVNYDAARADASRSDQLTFTIGPSAGRALTRGKSTKGQYEKLLVQTL
jgi:hypothetical protein